MGGGVIGCSVAYHLSKLDWTDVVLLERKQLTSGTTWHAAGLVGQLRTSINMTKLARYTSDLYSQLEAETGQATGYRQCGSISLATNTERFEELKRSAGGGPRLCRQVRQVGRFHWPRGTFGTKRKRYDEAARTIQVRGPGTIALP